VVTRADLPPGDQAVQAMHAALDFAASHQDYQAHTGAVVLLAARDELELIWLANRAFLDQIDHSPFCEPDLGNQLTAVAFDHRGAKLCRKYPLALKETSHVPAHP
jgi:hypothetical protein